MGTHEFWIKHFAKPKPELHKTFLALTPNDCDEILGNIGVSSANEITYESAENRVFGFDEVVVKFYRPGRWSLEAIQDEVNFLEDLAESNIPFVRNIGGIGEWNGIYYLVFKRIPSSFVSRDVLDESSVRQMVHIMARIHEIGRKRDASERAQFNPTAMCEACFEVVQKSGFLPQSLHKRYRDVMDSLVEKFNKIENIPIQRIHGDAYSGNIVWGPEGPVFIDLDDFQVGPTALDIKLLSFPWRLDSLPEGMDKGERREIQHKLVLDCYREVSSFPKHLEALFPLLSAYRDIQFDAWFSARWKDPGFAENYKEDDITSFEWWENSIMGLERSLL